jgi:NADPH:quinone reductase
MQAMANATTAGFSKAGGPDVIEIISTEVGAPQQGQVLVRQTAIGVNYQDAYHRSGMFKVSLPSALGMEAAGHVEAIGPGVETVKVGDRVAYGGVGPGAYTDLRILPADRVVPIPAGVSDEDAAAVLMKGMTVEYLLRRCYPLRAGETALVYAAAGGVGLIAGQWGHHLGARMIGVAGGADKCKLALEHGYDVVIDRKLENVKERVKELTKGAGVQVVYDSVGKASFDDSIASLAPRGYFVSFGATTGPVPPVEASMLLRGGSLYFTRPTLQTYIARRDDLVSSAKSVFDLVASGTIKVKIGQRFSLHEAGAAHRAMEAGETVGSSILLP